MTIEFSNALTARLRQFVLATTLAIAPLLAAAPHAQAEILSLLHTNDLHSHFRADRSSLRLGGLARLKTLADRLRLRHPHTLMVDGGDWSEGSIYYMDGYGAGSLALMDQMGYDAVVVGNHDFINGPEALLSAIERSHPRFSVLAANLDLSSFKDAARFRKEIPAYTIKQVGTVKVAFIGLTTYEFMYDKFFKPVGITEPIRRVRNMAREIRENNLADAVIAISHNSVAMNKLLLKAAPDLDLVVGAHDHITLREPTVVSRGTPGTASAHDGWVVETGAHGRYLGQVILDILPRAEAAQQGRPSVILKQYRLIQADRSVPEDPQMLALVEKSEAAIEKFMKRPMFQERLAPVSTEVSVGLLDNDMGHLVTDAYRSAVPGAVAGFDQANLVYGRLYSGELSPADVFNVLPGIPSVKTGKTWTIKGVEVKGSSLRWLINLVVTRESALADTAYVSGAQVILRAHEGKSRHIPFYDLSPMASLVAPSDFSLSRTSKDFTIESMMIGGEPLQTDRYYKLAINQGLVETMEFINSYIPGFIRYRNVVDSGVEAWQALANRFRTPELARLTIAEAKTERIRTREADLSLVPGSESWVPFQKAGSHEVWARLEVTVKNRGLMPSGGDQGTLHALRNLYGSNLAIERDFAELASLSIPPLDPGQSARLRFPAVRVGESRGIYPVTFRILYPGQEANRSNNELSVSFSPSVRTGISLPALSAAH